jgi:hypothetical protein
MGGTEHMRILAIILSATLAGCSAVEPSGLHLDIALDKNVVAVADSVRLTLTLSNTSLRTLSVLPADAYGICAHAFEAFDAQGHDVSIATAFCAAFTSLVAPTPVDLAPGARITIKDWWKPTESTVDGHAIPLGTYRLRGRVVANGTHFVRSDPRTVEVVVSLSFRR